MISNLSKLKLKLNRLKHAVVTLAFLAAYFTSTVSPLIPVATAAAGDLAAGSLQGQLNPSGSYSSGNITTYQEGDTINFRFNLSSTAAATGQMQIEFTAQDTGCLFFEGSFLLLPQTGSTGAAITVNTATSSPVSAGSDWVQVLNVTASGVGNTTVNYQLQLSDGAGECGAGSPQHSRLSNTPGDTTFKNMGNQNIPVPANAIIELPEIVVEKWVDTTGDGVVDRLATSGEWWFSLDGGTSVATNANGQVIFTNVSPDGAHTIVESPGTAGNDYTFLSGGGNGQSNCTFSGQTATANVTSGTTATDAKCVFNNTIRRGSITITKDALPNSSQDFSFSTTGGSGFNSFSLDDDADATLPNTRTFTNLLPGVYTVTEGEVAGWDFADLTCSEGVEKNGTTATITITPGANVSCTYTNRQRGQIIVQKVTQPAGDTRLFSVIASGGTIYSNLTQSISTTQSAVYSVAQNTSANPYNISESSASGWSQTGNTCSNLVVDENTPLDVNGVPTLTCTITNTKLAKLTIVKNSLPNDAQDFVFYTTGLTTFTLDDDEGAVGEDTTYSNTKIFSNLAPNVNYSVTENETAGWRLTNLTCVGGGVTSNLTSRTVNFSPQPGDEASCTFDNTKLGTINGFKWNDLNGNGSWDFGEPTMEGWQITLMNGTNTTGTTTTLSDGSFIFANLLPSATYSLGETDQDGWYQTHSPLSPITLTAGQTLNDQNFGNQARGTLRVLKEVDDGFGNVSSSSSWTWDYSSVNGYGPNGSGSDLATGSEAQTVPADDYDIHEDQKPNYHFTSLTCTRNGQQFTVTQAESAVVGVGANDNVVCTYKNTRDTGTITVTKNVVNDNGGTLEAEDFQLKVNDTVVDSGEENTYPSNVEYSVSESEVDGYRQTSLVCKTMIGPLEVTLTNPFTLEEGQEVNCEITNDDIAPKLIVVKHVDNSGTYSTKTADDFTLYAGGDNVSQPSFMGSEDGVEVTLDVGDYAVSEALDVGYADSYSEDCEGKIDLGETKTCTVTNTAIPAPAIQVVKDGPGNARVGETVTYSFKVINTGNVPLTISSVLDNIAGVGVYVSGDINFNDLLDKNEIWLFKATKDITANGPVTNTVTVCAFDNNEEEVCDEDSHTTIGYTPQVLGESSPPARARAVLSNTGANSLGITLMSLTISSLSGLTIFSGKRLRRMLSEPFVVPTTAASA